MAEGWTEISASWKMENAFIGKNKTGGAIQMGSLAENPGFSPMQLLLMALAGCTGMDIVSILQKKHLHLTDLKVNVNGKRAEDYPKIWTDIHVVYLVWGESLKPKDVEQAIRLSEDKYCSVGIMLGKTAKITSEYHLLKPGEQAD